MRHDHRGLVEAEHPRILADRDLLAREGLHRIAARPPVAVAHAGEIHGGDVVVAREERRDEIPPMGMRRVAVHQQQARPAPVAPARIMDLRAGHLDEIAFRLDPERILEPFRRRRRRAVEARQRPLSRLEGEHLLLGVGQQARHGRDDRNVAHASCPEDWASARGPSSLNTPVPVMTVRSPVQMRPRTV